MTWVDKIRDRARSLWLGVLRSTHAADDVDALDRVIDGKGKDTSFDAPRFDIEAHLSRWESYNASPRG